MENKRFWNCREDVCQMAGCKTILANLDTFYLGQKVELEVDGKKLERRVYDGPEGLFVFIKNCKVCYEDFE